MSQQIASTIETALKESPICNQIVRFLVDNETAMDTVKGVATWWLGCDEIAAQAALEQLAACGAVTVRARISGPLYGLTGDPEIRASLRAILQKEHPENEPVRLRDKKVLASHGELLSY